MSAGRNRVGTYLGRKAFYEKDTARKWRADQRTTLPPRCAHCRLPGTVLVNGAPHCPDHALECDTCCTGEESVIE